MIERDAYPWESRLFNQLGVDKFIDGIAAQKTLLVFSLALALLCYGYEIFGFSLRIDAEWYALSEWVKEAWIRQGRWGMYWLSYWLLATPVIPVIPIVLCVGGLIVGGCFWLASMNRNHRLASYLLLAMLISSPVYYFVNYFITLGYGVGIGCTLVGIATFFLMKRKWHFLPLVVVLYACATGIYQALLPVTAVAFGVCLLDHHLDRRDDYRFIFTKLSQYIGCVVGGYLLYQYILSVNLSSFNLQLDAEYLQAFSQLQLTPAALQESAKNSLRTLLGYYFGEDAYYLNWHNMLYLQVVVLGAVALLVFSSGRGVLSGLLSILMFFTVLAVPLALLILNNGSMPGRTQVSVVWVLAGSVYLAARVPSLTLRTVLTVLVVWLVYQFAIVINRYSLAAALEWEHSKHLSLQLMSELNRQRPVVLGSDEPQQVALEIVGAHPSKDTVISPNRDVIGASFFEWDGGSAMRITALWHTMGVYDYRVADDATRRALVPASQLMPSWPQPGSVAWIDGVAVIKLSDYTLQQIAAICSKESANSDCPLAPNIE